MVKLLVGWLFCTNGSSSLVLGDSERELGICFAKVLLFWECSSVVIGVSFVTHGGSLVMLQCSVAIGDITPW